MITLTREEAQQVLDALENKFLFMASDCAIFARAEAMKTLRSRLNAPEPEPVLWIDVERAEADPSLQPNDYINEVPVVGWAPLYLRYTAPPQRKEWQSLTDEEAKREFEKHNCIISADLAGILARAIEAKLKEKNI